MLKNIKNINLKEIKISNFNIILRIVYINSELYINITVKKSRNLELAC